ncbi:hypothetical protein EF847_01600 [Actinobacteria bacterium YIM 96077]|uniref:Uncharacterized protein n=1 Tax=Phytoactinopolyspora halophila TaxID=1981511 RepID=A0A329QGS7_9ACTN|nr:hypothetical protein [Phytoactinopolyspora halophila]AYY11615.1 hypothetical protein EF847_01600 [Actinobacteria bacterium YIM 96077]RAW11161.1 hypothetical protein DPM12_17625 [Phytoactinopolyspora halophila]
MASLSDIAEAAGMSVGFFREAGIMDVLRKARDGKWAPDRVAQEIRNSDWYQSTAESERQNLLLKHQDPAEFQARRESVRAEVFRVSRETGLGWGIEDGALHKAADMALLNNWSETQIRNHLAGLGSVEQRMKKGKALTGDAGAAEAMVRQLSQDFGIDISDSFRRTMVSNMAHGKWDENYARNYFAGKARNKYRALADDIDRGMTVREAAEPYTNAMAQLLEINPAEADLNDPLIKKAITSRDGLMDMQEFETRVRNDERWMRTKNAQDDFMSAGREILQLFGQIA